MIVSRIKRIMPYVVGPLQTSFIKRRTSVDNYIILQKLIHFSEAKVSNLGYMILKLDLKKAYDRVE